MRAMKLNAALFAVVAGRAGAAVAQNQTIRIHAATVLDGTGKIAAATPRSSCRDPKSRRSKPATPATRPTISDSSPSLPGHDRRARARRLALRQGRPLRRAAGHAGTRNSLQRRERLRHADGRLHDDPKPRTGQRRRAARRRSRAACFPGPRILTSIRQINERSGTPDEIRAEGPPAEDRRRRRRQDLRVRQHPRRRQADDDRRAAAGGVRRGQRAWACARWSTRTARSRSRRRSTPAASRSSTACSRPTKC